MASLQKKGRYWQACFRDNSGRQHQRSTKIPIKGSDRQETARLESRARIAASKLEMVARGEVGAGAHLRRTLSELIDLTGRQSNDSLGECVARHLVAAESHYAVSSYKAVTRIMNFLVERVGASTPVDGVTPEQLQGLIDRRVKETSAGSAEKERKFMSKFFKDAVKQGLIDRNPVAATYTPKHTPVSRVPFTEKDIEAILGKCNGEWGRAVNISLMTGLRLHDATRLESSHYDKDSDAVSITESKTNKPLLIPVNDTLRRYLKRKAVTPGLSKHESGALGKMFDKILADAEIDRQPVKQGKNTVYRKSFHSLRHTFVTRLADAGVDPEIRRKLAGHSSVEVHEIYAHHNIERMRDAIRKLG